jgi:hypothetical protein
MDTVDTVFRIVFARYRRKFGELKFDSAWFRASYAVSTYVSWPIAAATWVGVMLAYAIIRAGTPIEHKRWGQFAGAVAWLIVSAWLDHRFKTYRLHPPALAAEESPAEKQLVFRFRAVSIAVFAWVCLVGFLLHRMGVEFLQGF